MQGEERHLLPGADSDDDEDFDLDNTDQWDASDWQALEELSTTDPTQGLQCPPPHAGPQDASVTASDSMKSRLLINPNKAGTQNADRAKIQEIIYEASKGSPFFLSEQRKDAEATVKIAKYVAQAKEIRAMDLRVERSVVHQALSALQREAEAAEPRTIVCVDMDAFYASVEELDNPELKSKPMAVGGIGMLCTANYEARKYGVRSAMPGYIARKLCPQLLIVPLHFDRYGAISAVVREVFAIYDPNFSAFSLDEGLLDITKYLADHPGLNAEEAVSRLREEIFKRTGLTASAGIAGNKMLAKVCSDFNKPNGQMFLPSDPVKVRLFIDVLPVRKVPGVGKVQERVFNALGIESCRDLRENLPLIYKMFSKIHFQFCLRVSLGVGSTELDSSHQRKSVGCERTFRALSASGKAPSPMHAKLKEISTHLWDDIQNQGVKGKRVTLKLKTTAFRLTTRARTLESFVRSEEELYRVAESILDTEIAANPSMTLRLMGISLSALSSLASSSDPASPGISRYLKRPKTQPKDGDASNDDENDEAQAGVQTLGTTSTCPICGKILEGDQRAMDEHVGRCLDDAESPSLVEAASTGRGKKKAELTTANVGKKPCGHITTEKKVENGGGAADLPNLRRKVAAAS
ncbi:hypothetical protein HDU87_003479 [Geranomyces variabilis]|uniref:DNA polymerase kappa n=1 Tax=Geranomyces variabilis TaxID=109894 RepID=A0AAD5TQ25_9FUNG|nr:hypothetical protein HDU87_003479 [Geranomyces variabilis]